MGNCSVDSLVWQEVHQLMKVLLKSYIWTTQLGNQSVVLANQQQLLCLYWKENCIEAATDEMEHDISYNFVERQKSGSLNYCL